MEYPIRLLGSQSGGIDTECTNHTFQLFHSLILHGCLEWAKERSNLWICFQNLKNCLVIEIEERKDMWHVTVLAQPILWLHLSTCMVKDSASRFRTMSLWLCCHLSNKRIAVLVVWHLLVVDKEIDTSCQEVDR